MKKILVLDQILTTYEQNCKMIKNMGYEVIGDLVFSLISINNRNKVKEVNPDGIVINSNINNDEGAIKYIRAVRKFSNCPVLFYSFMQPSENEIETIKKISNADFISWPFTVDALKEKLKAINL
jgi:hypothetical protein